jgi:hypothetical protein
MSTDTTTTVTAETKAPKSNPFKTIAAAAGSSRRRLTDAEKVERQWNEKALNRVLTNLTALRTGTQLVSEVKNTYRKLNAGTTAERVFVLLKDGVTAETIMHYTAPSGDEKSLPAIASRYDWASIFASAEGQGVSLAKMADDRGVTVAEVCGVFGLPMPEAAPAATEPVAVEAATAEAPKATVKRRPGKKAAA